MSDKEVGLVWLIDFEANPNGFYTWFEFLLVRLVNVRQGERFGLASRLRSESEWIYAWFGFLLVRLLNVRQGGRFGLASRLLSESEWILRVV
jgi:hypothetical protein